MNDENIIYVTHISENKAKLKFKHIEVDAFIGENGLTLNKQEGDKKTPIGEFELGIVFGTHSRDNLKLDNDINYQQLTDSMYWVSDCNSKYYNKFVDGSKIPIQWNSAEHLIDYKVQYEYAIEIKANPENIPCKGSAIFIHCENNKPTAGCISIKKEEMVLLISMINGSTKISIKI